MYVCEHVCVRTCVYVYMYVHLSACMFVYMHMHIYVFIHVDICVHTCVYVHYLCVFNMHAYTYVYICAYIYVCICAHEYVCVCCCSSGAFYFVSETGALISLEFWVRFYPTTAMASLLSVTGLWSNTAILGFLCGV